MIKPAFVVLATMFVAGVPLGATTWYVATNGNDSYSGTSLNQPFATPFKAMNGIASGDTIYVRGGLYAMTNELKTSKAGFATNYCKLWAYPGEKPVFNYTNAGSGKRGIYISKDYWHVKGIEVAYSRDNGIIIAGGASNIVEGCIIHDSNDDGITLGSTSSSTHDNLILNCDSYRNYQEGSGGNNGDGYAAKAGSGTNNVFRGCRAWHNSDDGWDCYDNNTGGIRFENCWSFDNGTNLWGVSGFSGNGNGFKLGGAGTLGRHTLKNCLAFDNHSKGFDHNGSLGGHTLYNCTGFRNAKWNFSFYDTPTNGTNVFKNCVSWLGLGNTNNIVPSSVMVSNSWQGFSVTAADFASLDTSLAFAPRNADYSLPTNGLARLAAGSQLIDAGVDVGLPYRGAAPDLGAYESGGPARFGTTPGDLQWTSGGFRLCLNDVLVHGTLIIRAATNLNQPVWESLFTNSPATNCLQFTDTSATNRPCRLYRAEER